MDIQTAISTVPLLLESCHCAKTRTPAKLFSSPANLFRKCFTIAGINSAERLLG